MQWPAPFFKRDPRAHKGDFGHIFILAGSARYAGAACLCARAALRCGAGLVTLGVPKRLYPVFAKKLTEVMVEPLADAPPGVLSKRALAVISEFLKKTDCLLIGPGLSQNAQTQNLIRSVLRLSERPMVIDADGINALSGHLNILREMKAPAILTPHPGEMARLAGVSVSAVQKNRKKVAKDFVLRYNMTLVLKGHATIVAASGEKITVNQTGNPGMASAGTGDVLSGIIAAFLAQGMKPYQAACRAVYVHGLAGDLAAEDKTQPGMIASDIVEYLPKALKKARANGRNKTEG